MSYFVFDQTASEAIRNHINGINMKKKSEEYYLNSNIALFLKDELKNINPFCQQINIIGNYVVCPCLCVRAFVRACVRACVLKCVCVCV